MWTCVQPSWEDPGDWSAKSISMNEGRDSGQKGSSVFDVLLKTMLTFCPSDCPFKVKRFI